MTAKNLHMVERVKSTTIPYTLRSYDLQNGQEVIKQIFTYFSKEINYFYLL